MYRSTRIHNLVFWAAIPFVCHGQGTISTVAGTGTSGFSGDGGPAISAKIGGFSATLGVAVDNGGNLLIVDGANNRIRKVDGAGIIRTVAGGGSAAGLGDGGQATSAQVFPGGAATDKQGNMYIAQGNLIRKVDTSGVITTVAGNVQLFNYSGDGGPALNAGFLATNVAVDNAGNFYIADSINQRIRKVNQAGIISTVAGTGTQGFSGDGGLAVNANLALPQGLSVDGNGNLFFADAGNARVRKVDTNGIITTVAGNGSSIGISENVPAISSGMTPIWVAVDGPGNLYIVEGISRIRKVNTAGNISTVAGAILGGFSGDGGPATSASLNGPTCVAVDGAGNIYIADTRNFRVRKVSVAAALVESVSGVSFAYTAGGAAPASQTVGLTSPGSSISFTAAATSNGNWLSVSPSSGTTPASLTLTVAGGLAAGIYNGSITISSSGAGNSPQTVAVTLTVSAAGAGTISTVAGTGFALNGGDGGKATSASLAGASIAVDSGGNFYVGDPINSRVRKINAAGTISTVAGNGALSFSGDGGAATSAALFYPYSLAADGAGNLYIGDYNNNRVRKVNSLGTISTVAGNGAGTLTAEGVQATSTSLAPPIAVAVDGSGNLYIADGISRIRKVSTAGIIATVAGSLVPGFAGDGGTATNANLFSPGGVAVDSAGNIYIADISNQRIRKVNTAGVISTLAGSGTKGFSGDGGPAIAAKIAFTGAHEGLAVDSAGTLYFTDTGNQRVRKVDTGGIITTVAGNGTAGFSGDGGPPNSAALNNPVDVALDTSGNLYVVDGTNYRIRKFAVATGAAGNPPAISANGVQNGASYLPGITPNAWATIQGANLAGTTDTWANAIVNGVLPTKLDGVSVSVGNQAAYVEYISSDQINFVVPANVGLGPVQVTVTTGSGTSSSVTVTSSQYGPAFFQWPNNQVVATRTDYTFAVKAGTFAGATTVAAKPGDVLVLWGTGFGPTTPVPPPGVQVPADQTYSTSLPVTVSINNVPATVYGAALASGYAGLYQVAIQMPPSMPDGDWPLVATIGGVSSPGGMVLSVKK